MQRRSMQILENEFLFFFFKIIASSLVAFSCIIFTKLSSDLYLVVRLIMEQYKADLYLISRGQETHGADFRGTHVPSHFPWPDVSLLTMTRKCPPTASAGLSSQALENLLAA